MEVVPEPKAGYRSGTLRVENLATMFQFLVTDTNELTNGSEIPAIKLADDVCLRSLRRAGLRQPRADVLEVQWDRIDQAKEAAEQGQEEGQY